MPQTWGQSVQKIFSASLLVSKQNWLCLYSWHNHDFHINTFIRLIHTGGELRNGVNGFLTSYATDSVRFSQQILDKEHAGTTNVFIR